jgi:hypothetical protein
MENMHGKASCTYPSHASSVCNACFYRTTVFGQENAWGGGDHPPDSLLLYLLPERRQINTGRGTDTQIGATVAQMLAEQRGSALNRQRCIENTKIQNNEPMGNELMVHV